MEIVYRCCAGLDVHKTSVTVCVRRVGSRGEVDKQTGEFGTTTRALLELGDWLAEQGATHLAMESTGVYWKPVWNLLEGRFELLLCNAGHVKQVPGRKTDVKDAEWLADLLQHGLLRGSFVPDRGQRELRDLTRQRTQLVQDRASVVNRIQKLLEDTNIKLASVATDVVGVSGRAMIRQIIAGERDAIALSQSARGRLRSKRAELEVALEGFVTEHHRFMLAMLMRHLEDLERLVAEFGERIEGVMAREAEHEQPDAPPFESAVALLTTIPGVEQRSAETILAEIGTDMSRFPSAGHLASWAGICPGNNKSAGKRLHTKTSKGNRWLRRGLTQAAWAASHTKGTYLAAQYKRLAARRGKKRAIIAVAHSILVAIWHMLSEWTGYHELGAEHFDRLNPVRTVHRLAQRIGQMGYKVQLLPIGTPA